jgi:hypothetical protein
VVDRPTFEAELTRRDFQVIYEDLPNGGSLMMWYKACLHGCPPQHHVLDAQIYDGRVLDLLLAEIVEGDCSHPGDSG